MLTRDQVYEVQRMIAQGESNRAIRRAMGLGMSTVARIRAGDDRARRDANSHELIELGVPQRCPGYRGGPSCGAKLTQLPCVYCRCIYFSGEQP